MCNYVRWRRRNLRPDEVAVISGNSKLGRIPNVSLLPIVTCDRRIGCAKREECYACHLEFRGGDVWAHNTDLATEDPERFFESLSEQFAKRDVEFFRFFVSGDSPTRRFLFLMLDFCEAHPETRFLIFTKRYRWVAKWLESHEMPDNVSVVLSAWPGNRLHNPLGLPVAWLAEDPRRPANALPCPGDCEHCGMCWSLPEIGRDVFFHRH